MPLPDVSHDQNLASLIVEKKAVGNGKRLRREDPAPPEGTVKAPEQGFEGESVQHVDMDTATGDWRREYGPKGPPHHPAAAMKSNAKSATIFVGTMVIAARYW